MDRGQKLMCKNNITINPPHQQRKIPKQNGEAAAETTFSRFWIILWKSFRDFSDFPGFDEHTTSQKLVQPRSWDVPPSTRVTRTIKKR